MRKAVGRDPGDETAAIVKKKRDEETKGQEMNRDGREGEFPEGGAADEVGHAAERVGQRGEEVGHRSVVRRLKSGVRIVVRQASVDGEAAERRMVGPSGFEPEQRDSKSLVLPLHHGPVRIIEEAPEGKSGGAGGSARIVAGDTAKRPRMGSGAHS